MSARALLRSTFDLPRDCRAAIEHALGEPVGPVTVHVGRVADAANAARGTLAFARGSDVYLSHAVTCLPPAEYRWVLAHEVAHVVQQRRATGAASAASAADVPAVEAEACDVAWATLGGARRPVRLADVPGRAAAWGEAGHYYTVYVAMLAAGAVEEDARRAAFFAQMPDEVDEFDAKAMYLTWLGESMAVSQESTATFIWTERQKRRLEAFAQLQERMRIIHVGLHCLTGGPAEPETAFRYKTALSAGSPLEFGLALHAFGDSFAHRQFGDPTTMWNYGMGHGLRFSEPDDLGDVRRRALYLEYARWLHDIGTKRFRKAPPMTADRLVALLTDVTRRTEESAQITALKGIASSVSATLRDRPGLPHAARHRKHRRAGTTPKAAPSVDETARAFAAEDHGCVPWEVFRLANPHLDTHMKAQIDGLAQRWAIAPRDAALPTIAVTPPARATGVAPAAGAPAFGIPAGR